MPDPVDQHIGFRIRVRRLELGLSQEQLAAALGLSFQQVQKYEKGSNRCAPVRLMQLAEILQTPVASFFPDAEAALPRAQIDSYALALARDFESIENIAARAAIRQLVTALAATG